MNTKVKFEILRYRVTKLTHHIFRSFKNETKTIILAVVLVCILFMRKNSGGSSKRIRQTNVQA